MNHFAVFELPVAFDLDTEQLAERYRELQRTVHPDKFAHASDRDRRLAVQKASQINEAFQVLKDPLSRGRYLLELAGALTNDETDTAMDGAFLMQQMELREELAELKNQSDPLAAIADFVARMESATENLTSKLSSQLAANELEPARDTVRQMQFYKKLREEALFLEEGLLF
jgi:molecular chaperone HscB